MTRRDLGSDASRTMIPVEESFAAWRKDPGYVNAYDALEDEFSRAATMIKGALTQGSCAGAG
jgi:hypothetical protein